MRPRTFLAFVAPSVALMILFIAVPLVTVLIQSFYVTQPVFKSVAVESCTPGFPDPICTTTTRNVPETDETGRPVSQRVFVGLDTYRTLLAPDAVRAAFAQNISLLHHRANPADSRPDKHANPVSI